MQNIEFEKYGNSKAAWTESVSNLLMICGALNEFSAKVINESGLPFAGLDRFLFNRLMMRGYAIECLLKLGWLQKGKILCKDGSYKGICERENHDLSKLSDCLNLMPSNDEKAVLKVLSKAVRSLGRYPIEKTYKGSVSWSFPAHEKVFHGFLERVCSEVGYDATANQIDLKKA